MIQMIVMDVDGVLTDGKQYINGQSSVLKTVAFQDLDAVHEWKRKGYKLAVITGEKNAFTNWLKRELELPYFIEGCKDKLSELRNILQKENMSFQDICYVGDGRYDIPVLEKAGVAVCPSDAIREVKEICALVLSRNGGQGCIAELYSCLEERKQMNEKKPVVMDCSENIRNCLQAHQELITHICEDSAIQMELHHVCEMLAKAAVEGRKIMICGNGGSAADSQHFAAELVGRFYHEREAVDAEALTVNTSVMTALGNDYDYDRIFARQVEAKGKKDDILIGISTSGTSSNVREAFRAAKDMGLTTILLSGAKVAEYSKAANGINIGQQYEILKDTDELLAIPASDTPRIQEMHILFIHIMCQMIEERIMEKTHKK